MKLGFMTFVLPGYSIEQTVAFAKKAGYDGVEIRVDAGHKHGISSESPAQERRRVKDLFAAAGIEIPSVATSVKLSSPDAQRHADFMRMAKVNLDLAADLGASFVRIFCGTEVPKLDEATAARVAAAFDELGEYSKAAGVAPMLECGHDIVEGGNEIAMILGKITTANFCALWNHSTIDDVTLNAIKSRLRHLHVHNDVLDPQSDNILHLSKKLKPLGYQGYVCLEIIENKNLEEALLVETAKRLKRFMAQA